MEINVSRRRVYSTVIEATTDLVHKAIETIFHGTQRTALLYVLATLARLTHSGSQNNRGECAGFSLASVDGLTH